jgi:hypothetical protein
MADQEMAAPVVVHVAASPAAAEVVRAKLEYYGIRAALQYQSAGRVLGLVVDGWGETRVVVAAAQAEEARRILAEEELDAGEQANER